MRHILTAVAILLIIAGCRQSDGGESIVREIKTISGSLPQPPLAKHDPQGISEAMGRIREAGSKERELVWKLLEQYPDNPHLPALLVWRWSMIASNLMMEQSSTIPNFDVTGARRLVEDDIAKALKVHTNPAIKEAAEAGRIIAILSTQSTNATAESLRTKEFAEHYPESPFLDQMYQFGSMNGSIENRRHVLVGLLGSAKVWHYADEARAKLKLIDNLNHPFSMAFRDGRTGKQWDIKDARGKVVRIVVAMREMLRFELDSLHRDEVGSPGFLTSVIVLNPNSNPYPLATDTNDPKVDLNSIPYPLLSDKDEAERFQKAYGLTDNFEVLTVDKHGILRAIEAYPSRELVAHLIAEN